jgi:hypothetical protein
MKTMRRIEATQIIVSLLIILFFGVIWAAHDEAEWNGGHCEAGHEWELFDVERNRTDVYYYYTCECGEVIYLHEAR